MPEEITICFVVVFNCGERSSVDQESELYMKMLHRRERYEMTSRWRR